MIDLNITYPINIIDTIRLDRLEKIIDVSDVIRICRSKEYLSSRY
jgi:hypothetical protein